MAVDQLGEGFVVGGELGDAEGDWAAGFCTRRVSGLLEEWRGKVCW